MNVFGSTNSKQLLFLYEESRLGTRKGIGEGVWPPWVLKDGIVFQVGGGEEKGTPDNKDSLQSIKQMCKCLVGLGTTGSKRQVRPELGV